MTTARSKALDRAGVTSDQVRALEREGFVIVPVNPSDEQLFDGLIAAKWAEKDERGVAVWHYPPLSSIRAAWRAILAVVAAVEARGQV